MQRAATVNQDELPVRLFRSKLSFGPTTPADRMTDHTLRVACNFSSTMPPGSPLPLKIPHQLEHGAGLVGQQVALFARVAQAIERENHFPVRPP